MQSSSQSFAQGFSLPGEAEKAAKILATFLGSSSLPLQPIQNRTNSFPQADPDNPASALNSIPKVVLQRARGVSPSHLLLRSVAHPSCSLLHNVRPRRLSGPQGRLRFLRKSRLRPCHLTLTGRLVVRPIMHRDRWCWLGSPDRRGHHRLCYRPQQRRCGPCILPRRERHHRRQHQRYRRTYWYGRERPSESRTSCTDVLVLQVQGCVLDNFSFHPSLHDSSW